MNAILGVSMLAVSALFFAWAYGQFRRPRPKSWTQGDLGGTSVTLTLVILTMFGVFHLSAFLFNLESETRWLEIAAVTIGSLLVCWFAIPRLMAPALRAADAQPTLVSPSRDTLPKPANDPRPARPARSKRSAGRPGKHRAA